MRCKEVLEILDSLRAAETPAAVGEHLARCPGCLEYRQGLSTLEAGFRLLLQEEPPAPSVGFAARLLRRLERVLNEAPSGTEFLERVGRRFVYAASLLVTAMLLAVVLSSSGPLRATASISELYPDRHELASLESDPVLTEGADNADTVPVTLPSDSEHHQP